MVNVAVLTNVTVLVVAAGAVTVEVEPVTVLAEVTCAVTTTLQEVKVGHCLP